MFILCAFEAKMDGRKLVTQVIPNRKDIFRRGIQIVMCAIILDLDLVSINDIMLVEWAGVVNFLHFYVEDIVCSAS